VVAVATPSIFREGIYTVEQVAHLARLSPRTLRRWFDGEGEGEPALIRRIPKNDAQVFGFLDLVQSLAIRALRNTGKLSLQKIRQTITEAEKLGVQYPFARDHKTFVFADDVVIDVNGQLFQVRDDIGNNSLSSLLSRFTYRTSRLTR
jgi:DNA-binding transcriptional MerR regulator